MLRERAHSADGCIEIMRPLQQHQKHQALAASISGRTALMLLYRDINVCVDCVSNFFGNAAVEIVICRPVISHANDQDTQPSIRNPTGGIGGIAHVRPGGRNNSGGCECVGHFCVIALTNTRRGRPRGNGDVNYFTTCTRSSVLASACSSLFQSEPAAAALLLFTFRSACAQKNTRTHNDRAHALISNDRTTVSS